MAVGFPLRYMSRELRRRRGRVVLTSLGLAAGVALLIALIGVSQGLSNAQAKVLSPLHSVGADVLVTRVAGATSPTGASPSPSASPGRADRGGGFGGGGFFGPGQGSLNQQDINALLQANSALVTDLAKLGKPGEKFTRDFFYPATLLTFPQQAITQVSSLPHVSSAVGALSLLATHQTGTVPQIVAQLKTGGQTITQTQRPAPLTDAERAKFRACVDAMGGFGGPAPGPSPSASGGRTGGGGGGFGGGAFETCLPERFQQFRASFTVPLETIRQVLDPPQTNIASSSYSASGVDTSHPDQGPVTRAQVVSGHYFDAGTTNEVLVNVAYANTHGLKVGAKLPINGTSYTVVGLVNPTLTGETSDIYLPLAAMQKQATQTGRVNMVLVRADSSSDVATVAAEINKILPGAQVVTTKALADQVSGSLSDAKKLTDRFGGALAAIVLLAAFAIAVLLTLSAVAKRVREIGTLRAIGWSKSMVVRQILLETLGIGVVGAVIGIALGVIASVVVSQLSPALTATNPTVPGQASSIFSRFIPNSAGTLTTTTSHVALSVPLHATTLVIGFALALVGGLLAGAAGGWRAARLAPAVALRDLG